jgi:two-component system sensor histidine kinase CreC
MTTLLRLTITLGAIATLSVILLVRAETDQLKRRSREATEEGLVDFVATLRNLINHDLSKTPRKEGTDYFSTTLSWLKNIETRKKENNQIDATIYGFKKNSVDTAVLLFDHKGILLFDSSKVRSLGESYADWLDVGLALRGSYGARTTSDRADGCSTMYSSLPLLGSDKEDIRGVITAAKSTCTSNLFVSQARRQVMLISITIFSGAAFVGFLALYLFTQPLRKLSHFVRSVRDGDARPPPAMPPGELRELVGAIEEMRQAIDGTEMTARYMRTISHELKSPLTAIRGAVEILNDASDSDPTTRAKFLKNIEQDTDRIVALVDSLITLNSLSGHSVLAAQEVSSLNVIIGEVFERVRTQAEARSITLRCDFDEDSNCDPTIVYGSPFLIREAITNVIRNALSFSPEGASIELVVSRDVANVLLTIRDHGPGIPSWAFPKIFDQFFSLPRPTTGLRSSGLGLPIAREAIARVGGTLELRNGPAGGVIAQFLLKRAEQKRTIPVE